MVSLSPTPKGVITPCLVKLKKSFPLARAV